MSDNRRRPRIHRTDDKHDRDLRAYAKEHGIEPWRALEVAIQRLSEPIETGTLQASVDIAEGVQAEQAAEIKKLRAAVTRAENVALAREKQRDDAIADCAAEHATAEALRRDLESAREATRRADAAVSELEQANRDLGLDVAALRKMHEAEKGAHERCAAEVERLTREIAAVHKAMASAGYEHADKPLPERWEAAYWRDKKQIEDLIGKAEDARSAAPRPCACALPAELDQRVRACIAARPNAVPPRDFAFVVKNGCDRIEGSDRYQDKIKAENAAKRAEREAERA